MNKLGIIILNWNGEDDTIECITSIRNNEDEVYPIFLLDNASQQSSITKIEKWLESDYGLSYVIMNEEEFEQCNEYVAYTLYFIKSKKNMGFAKGNNFIWDRIKNNFEYVFLLNNDTVIEKQSIANMLIYMDENPNTGVISCDIRLYNHPDKLWNAGGFFTWYGDRKYYSQKKIDMYKARGIKSIKTPFITGCALLCRREIANKYGTFTEKFFFGEEDFNYCKRLQQHKVKVESVLHSTIYHKVSTSIKKTQSNINKIILHFSNRIIDMKIFYKPLKWKLWRIAYLIAIFFKVYLMTYEIKQAMKVVKYVYHYTSNFEEITYETYIEISNLL